MFFLSRVSQKIQSCRTNLRLWNKHSFGHIHRSFQQKKQDGHLSQSTLNRKPSNCTRSPYLASQNGMDIGAIYYESSSDRADYWGNRKIEGCKKTGKFKSGKGRCDSSDKGHYLSRTVWFQGRHWSYPCEKLGYLHWSYRVKSLGTFTGPLWGMHHYIFFLI